MSSPRFPPFPGSALAWTLFLLFGLVAGQTTHIVQVGWDGSFFTPATVSALLNDTVRFIFAGNFHSVAQSTFSAPCTPLRGGFDSGPVGQTSAGEFPFWDLKVTNVSQPIWYFCYITTPTSHCNAGMVGVINPPSIQNYNDFLSSAKAVVGTPQVTPSVRLTGVGAFATAPPAVSSSFGSLSITSTPPLASSTPSSLPTSSSAGPSETPAPSGGGSKTNVGAIAGGTVGGVVGILLIAVLFFWWQRNKKQDETINEFFNYRMAGGPPQPPSDMLNVNAGRRVLPPPAAPHYTTPVAPRIRKQRSLDGQESNRGSVPTYSSDAKSNKSADGAAGYGSPPRSDGYLGGSVGNSKSDGSYGSPPRSDGFGSAPSRDGYLAGRSDVFTPPRVIAHPYMGVHVSEQSEDTTPVSVPHLTSMSQVGGSHGVGGGGVSQGQGYGQGGSQHGHGHGGSQLGHGHGLSNGSSTQLPAGASGPEPSQSKRHLPQQPSSTQLHSQTQLHAQSSHTQLQPRELNPIPLSMASSVGTDNPAPPYQTGS